MAASSSLETRFDDPGTLRPPGPIGRLVRLVLGVWLLSICWLLWRQPDLLVREDLPLWSNLVAVGFALWLIPPVVNIGFGTDFRAWPRHLAGGAIVAWVALLLLTQSTAWSAGLGRFAWLLVMYTFGHLGVSFVLAAALATPGCEMRAIPHLWTLLTGRATKEHFCPGFLNGLDAWETGRGAGSA